MHRKEKHGAFESVLYLGQTQGMGRVEGMGMGRVQDMGRHRAWVPRAHLAGRSPLRKQYYLVPHKGATCSVRSIAE
jgi:hypothetical protein